MDTADIKLFDSELKVMEVLWTEGDVTARHIADVLEGETGWNVNTTYTVIKRCVKKGVVERREPHFVCHALVTREVSRRPRPTRWSSACTAARSTSCSRRSSGAQSCLPTRPSASEG